jgi:hypothetical protein
VLALIRRGWYLLVDLFEFLFRAETPAAIKQCKEAGIKVFMITVSWGKMSNLSVESKKGKKELRN